MKETILGVVLGVIASLIVSEIRCRKHLQTVSDLFEELLEQTKETVNNCVEHILGK